MDRFVRLFFPPNLQKQQSFLYPSNYSAIKKGPPFFALHRYRLKEK